MSHDMKLISAEDLFFQPLDHTRSKHIVDGLIPLGLTILAGAPKSGKSWMMLDIALAVSSGRPFFGKETEQCGVLYCALEDTEERLQARLLDLAEAPSEHLHFVKTCPKTDAGFQTSLREILEQNPKIKLVIVDTLQKIRGGGSGKSSVNQYERDDGELSKLKKFADRYGIAIVLVHHLRKMKDRTDPLNEISGSTAISGTADTILVLQKDRSSPNATLVLTGRDVQQKEMILRFVHPRWELVQEKTEEEIAKERIPDCLYRVVEYIKQCHKWTGTASELLEVIGEKEMAANAFSASITKFYYEVFAPECIKISSKRSSGRRERTFIYTPAQAGNAKQNEECAEKNDDSDAYDGDIDTADNPSSSSSLASLDDLNGLLEGMFELP